MLSSLRVKALLKLIFICLLLFGVGIFLFTQSRVQKIFAQNVLVADCRIFESELNLLAIFPAIYCDYDFKRNKVLLGNEHELVLADISGNEIWSAPHSDLNHDVTVDEENARYYSLDYKLSEVDDKMIGFSVVRGFNERGEEFFNWSPSSIYSELLEDESRELLLTNHVRDEVQIDGGHHDLAVLINNIQILENTKLKTQFHESGRYLVLTFSNLNHIAILDMKERRIVKRYRFFKNHLGSYIHMPQFLPGNKVLVFENINLKNPPKVKKLLYTKRDDFYSRACIFDLNLETGPLKCWPNNESIHARIMGSAQLLDDLVLLTYCESYEDLAECRIKLLDSDSVVMWDSKEVEAKFGLPLISTSHLYRAELIPIVKMRPFTDSL